MWLKDLKCFFFPAECPVCGSTFSNEESPLCLECEYGMPRTAFRDKPDNPAFRVFWGKIRPEMATALLRFEKGSAYRSLVHEIKYRGNRKAGIFLGKMLGTALEGTMFSSCDVLIPVPLHPRRLRERGYNQSFLIALGFSAVTGIPVMENVLARTVDQPSQTKLGRYERFLNVSGQFAILPGRPDLDGMRILLVDDVLTTGATMEACGRILLEEFRCRLYLASACYA